MQFAARLAAWYLRPVVLRAAGYTRAAEAVERGRKFVAGASAAAGATAAVAGLAGSTLSRRRKFVSEKTVAMETPGTGRRRPPKRGRSNSSSSLLPSVRQPQMVGRRVKDSGGYTQIEYKYDQSGVRLGKEARMLKALTPALYPKVDRWQRLGDSTATRGAFLLNCSNTTATATTIEMPVYAFDLTSIDQVVGVDPTVPVNTFAVPGVRSYFDQTTDTFRWTPLQCLRADGSTLDLRWQTELGARITPNVANQGPKATPRCFFDWADIKMVLYGPRSYPSTVKVSIVQFTDPGFKVDAFQTLDGNIASFVAEDNSASYSGNDANRYKDFWASRTDKLVGNPIARRGFTKSGAGLNVLYSKTFEFNPTLGDELDDRGHQFVFEYRYNHNKVIDYCWDMQDTELIDDFVRYPNKWQQQSLTRTINVVPAIKGRVFLMVEGFASQFKTDPTEANNYDFYPSFDIMLRRKTVHVHGITANI